MPEPAAARARAIAKGLAMRFLIFTTVLLCGIAHVCRILACNGRPSAPQAFPRITAIKLDHSIIGLPAIWVAFFGN